MSKKLKIVILIMIASLTIGFLPRQTQVKDSIVHQHQIYPMENEQLSGFDEYGNLTTHLPIIIIKANGNGIPGAKEISNRELKCEYEVIDYENHLNTSTSTPTQTGRIAINVRGNSSRHYKKKQYAIRTIDQMDFSIDTSFFGMPAENNWILNGSYIDYSQIRNYMLYNISAEIMEYAPKCRFCEVFITNADGELEYQGLYTMIEKPNETKNRMNLSKYDPKYKETSFLLQMNSRIDDYKIEHLNQDSIRPNSFNLEYPKVLEITNDSLSYIKEEMLKFEKSLYDAFFTDDWKLLNQQINLNSFVDYYIINEFFQNYDAGRRSTYLYKELGNQISIGPVWDFDGAFNNYEGVDFPIELLAMKETIYYFHLSQNPEFIKKCVERYYDLRKTVLSDQYLINYIESTCRYLGSAALRNVDRWYEGNYTVYENDIDKMKSFVKERGKWMDENFEKFIENVK